jgi:hypothetical protein
MSVPFEELGVPVHSVNWVRTHAASGPDGNDRVWVTMGQQAAGFFILDIDPVTGACTQILCENSGSNYPTAAFMARSGVLYVGVAHTGHLYAYDGTALTDLGAIHPEKAIFPCRIDEDRAGKIWVGSYGGADLTRFDPETDAFERFGSVDDVDMYCYPLADYDTGMIACLIKVTQQHVVLFDPESGASKPIGPSLTKEEGTVDLIRGVDDCLYIVSTNGVFRIDGDAAVPISEEVEEPAFRLKSGRTFRFLDGEIFLYRKIAIESDGVTVKVIDVVYEAAGSRIYMLHEGPDHRVYGSSILPLHLFAYDPVDGETIDYGKASESGGEAYSMANFEQRMFISSYPAARISVYNPGAEYVYGLDASSNPRDLGRIDDISYRPRATLTGPLGRVWTASLPDYGLWGGPLAWLDPESGERGSYRNVAGEGSCYVLADLPDQGRIAIGTTITAGTGTQPKEPEAKLLLWDYETEQVTWSGIPISGLTTINALCLSGDKLLGTAMSEDGAILFAFDPAERRFEVISDKLAGRPLDLGLQLWNGSVYGFTSDSVYRIEGQGVEVVCTSAGLFSVPGPIVEGRAYFATGHQLRRLSLS